MPYYTFQRKDGNAFVKEMSNAERETYLQENPDIKQIITKVTLLDSVRLGIKKPPADFQKYVIGRKKATIPENNIGENSKFDIPKEI